MCEGSDDEVRKYVFVVISMFIITSLQVRKRIAMTD